MNLNPDTDYTKYVKKTSDTTWKLTPYSDGEDLILTLPDEVCDQLGIEPGDILDWIINDDGTVSLKKKEEDGPKV